MPKYESAIEIIARLAAGYDAASDEQVLAFIAAIAPLADESDACWKTEEYWQVAADPFLALSDVAAKRRLRPAVRLLLERACYGDPGEIMRGLRHEFEATFKPDWTALADVYLELARSPRLGTRLWAIDGLLALDDPRALPVFKVSVREDPKEIRWRAKMGVDRSRPDYHARMKAEADKEHAEQVRAQQERLDRQAEADAKLTDRRCSACGKPLPSYRRTCKHCGADAKQAANP